MLNESNLLVGILLHQLQRNLEVLTPVFEFLHELVAVLRVSRADGVEEASAAGAV